jgi:hypothetical protein
MDWIYLSKKVVRIASYSDLNNGIFLFTINFLKVNNERRHQSTTQNCSVLSNPSTQDRIQRDKTGNRPEHRSNVLVHSIIQRGGENLALIKSNSITIDLH